MNIQLGLTGKSSIEQCIQTILTTPKGAVPFRPSFGFGAEDLLGGTADKLKIRKEIINQLNTYEPRIDIMQVNFKEENFSHLKISLEYKIKETGEISFKIFNI